MTANAIRRWLMPDRLIPAGLILVFVLTVLLWLAFLAPAWLWHPLGQCAGTPVEIVRCKSYNFHSGIEGNVTLLALFGGMVTGLIGWWHHHNCHSEGCPHFGHPHPEHGWPACRDHWDEIPSHIVSANG